MASKKSTKIDLSDVCVRVRANVIMGSHHFARGESFELPRQGTDAFREFTPSINRGLGSIFEFAVRSECPNAVTLTASQLEDRLDQDKRRMLQAKFLAELVQAKVEAVLEGERAEREAVANAAATQAFADMHHKKVAQGKAASARAAELRAQCARLEAEAKSISEKFTGEDLPPASPEPTPVVHRAGPLRRSDLGLDIERPSAPAAPVAEADLSEFGKLRATPAPDASPPRPTRAVRSIALPVPDAPARDAAPGVQVLSADAFRDAIAQ